MYFKCKFERNLFGSEIHNNSQDCFRNEENSQLIFLQVYRGIDKEVAVQDDNDIKPYAIINIFGHI